MSHFITKKPKFLFIKYIIHIFHIVKNLMKTPIFDYLIVDGRIPLNTHVINSQ